MAEKVIIETINNATGKKTRKKYRDFELISYVANGKSVKISLRQENKDSDSGEVTVCDKDFYFFGKDLIVKVFKTEDF